MPDLDTIHIALRLGVAAFCGGIVGLERELREREAGLRTHLLVCVGAALFTLVSAYAWSDWTFSNASGIVFDPTRIAAQIVSGIGFLGAGAIIKLGEGERVRGLTTAAGIWSTSAIGMAAGLGEAFAALVTTILALVVFWAIPRLLRNRPPAT